MHRTWTASDGETWLYMGKVYSATDPICDVAGSNYVGMFGIGEPGVERQRGVLPRQLHAFTDITDGLTQTLCVGERSTNLNLGRGQATWTGAVPGAVFWSCAPNPFDPDGGTCVREDGSGMILGHTGEGHGPGDPTATSTSSSAATAAARTSSTATATSATCGTRWTIEVYKALSTRAGGEIISDDY